MKILFVGGSPSKIGGQGRVAYYTIQQLVELGAEVVSAGKGSIILDPGDTQVCPTYEFHEDNPQGLYTIIEEQGIDTLILSHDVWLFYFLPELRTRYPHIVILGWFTIDATPLHSSWLPILKACDFVFTSSKFGKEVIYARSPVSHVSVLNYGLTEDFKRPKRPRPELKKAFSSQWDIELSGKTVFTFAGLNQAKKAIGCMVDAFDLLNNPDTHLILALKSGQSKLGGYRFLGDFDLPDLVRNPNISIIQQPLSDAFLVDLYQLTDYFLYPSQGEAPGLQMSEAQKCGAIPIATNYSGLIEESCFPEFLINGYVAVRGQFNCYRAIVDARALAELMAKAVAYPSQDDYLESYSQFCRRVDLRFANRSWKSVGKTLYETAQSIHNGAVLIDNELTEI